MIIVRARPIHKQKGSSRNTRLKDKKLLSKTCVAIPHPIAAPIFQAISKTIDQFYISNTLIFPPIKLFIRILWSSKDRDPKVCKKNRDKKKNLKNRKLKQTVNKEYLNSIGLEEILAAKISSMKIH